MSSHQQTLFEQLVAEVERSGLGIRVLDRADFVEFGVMGEIRRTISEAAGCIVLGFSQLEIEKGKWRDSPIENEYEATPWNQVEAGMAAMRGIPILIVCSSQLCEGGETSLSRGIFALSSDSEDKIFGPMTFPEEVANGVSGKNALFKMSMDMNNDHYHNWVAEVKKQTV